MGDAAGEANPLGSDCIVAVDGTASRARSSSPAGSSSSSDSDSSDAEQAAGVNPATGGADCSDSEAERIIASFFEDEGAHAKTDSGSAGSSDGSAAGEDDAGESPEGSVKAAHPAGRRRSRSPDTAAESEGLPIKRP